MQLDFCMLLDHSWKKKLPPLYKATSLSPRNLFSQKYLGYSCVCESFLMGCVNLWSALLIFNSFTQPHDWFITTRVLFWSILLSSNLEWRRNYGGVVILSRRNLCFCSGFKPSDELGMWTTVYLCLINNKVLLKMKCPCHVSEVAVVIGGCFILW